MCGQAVGQYWVKLEFTCPWRSCFAIKHKMISSHIFAKLIFFCERSLFFAGCCGTTL